uniref:Uncharacterized protein n=1 Tax=Anguilla anguilla TaxID=7936 RepID=A0A0E9SVM1_ANGAN
MQSIYHLFGRRLYPKRRTICAYKRHHWNNYKKHRSR